MPLNDGVFYELKKKCNLGNLKVKGNYFVKCMSEGLNNSSLLGDDILNHL